MRRIRIDGGEIAYEERGAGPPVVLLHAGVCADWFAGLMAEPALAGAYRLIRCHRPGYGGSDPVEGAVTVARMAEHCRALLRHLGVERAHLVGHSSSAVIALQLAIDHPEVVHSLALLETALLAVPSGSFAGDALRSFAAGNRPEAVDIWMRGVCGPRYREVFDAVLPGAIDRAAADAGTFFGQELPAVRAWSFGPAEAGAVTRPVLLVLGERSADVSAAFAERHALLRSWLPRAEPFVLPGANHLMHLQNPAGLAVRLAAFFAREAGPAGNRSATL
ncbi:alpha/beta fold hydrolase [Paractinoplanes rhizophilus]|uniref:Alpha/beta fold hydrolase n=1 Tax=Paractinoplanes rhizophilus TaxID=1416877 RepID=A0ABW2HNE4_9ACTN